jgi:endonuclease/exonuclease/phosphatase family metal-dependent hydrolase
LTRLLCACLALIGLIAAFGTRPSAAVPQDIALDAESFGELHGNWSLVASPSSPDGVMLASEDRRWASRSTALASPTDYVEAEFTAPANTDYRVWLRLRATGNSKWNDSVWVQFSDAVDETGAPAFRAGTADALLVNLESCYACGVSGWGWQDHAWWTGQSSIVRFAAPGLHTIRIQTREDGVMFDQVVLSPARFLTTAPGPERDDVSAGVQLSASTPASTAPAPAASPYAGSQRFAALTWNIEISSQDEAGARREIAQVASLSPQPAIVVLQEARGSLYSAYVDELATRTGRAWSGVFQGHCARDAWDESAAACRSVQDEGVLVLSDYPVAGKSTKLLPYADCWHSARAAVRAVLDVQGSLIEVYGTHLQTGTCTDAAAARVNSIAALKMWISRSPGPAVVAGDFNEVPGAPAFTDPGSGMLASFIDAWSQAGAGPGLTYPVPSPNRRIDYWFVDRGGKVSATSARVVTSATGSDHYPVLVELATGQ